MVDKVVVPVPDVNEKPESAHHQPEPGLSDKAINFGDGFAKGVIHVAEGYLAMAEHPLETAAVLNPVNAVQQNAMAFAGAALGDPESQDHLARQIDPFVKAANKIAEAVDGDLTAKGQVAGFALAGAVGPVPPGARVAASAEKEIIAAETRTVVSETLPKIQKVDNSLHADAPKLPLKYRLSEAAVNMLRGKKAVAEAEAFAQTPAGQLSDMLQATSMKLTERNTLKEALDRSDSSMLPGGGTVRDKHLYDTWNQEQITKRSSFWNQAFRENPQLAELVAQQKLTAHGFEKLLVSDRYDALLGIQPYNAERTSQATASATYGYDRERALAKQWGIEWNEQREGWAGVFDELRLKDVFSSNPELFAAKKAVDNAQRLDQLIHREFALGVINPERVANPEISEMTRRLLGAKIENGTISAEARNALPEEIRALPVTKLQSLQDRAAVVAPENLRLEAGYVAPQLEHDSSLASGALISGQHSNAASLSLNPQHIQEARRNMLMELSALIEQKPVAELNMPTPAVQAAQDKLYALNRYNNVAEGAGKSVAETIMDRVGLGYSFGVRKREEIAAAFAKSDYDGVKCIAREVVAKPVMVVATAGTGAVAGLPAAGALIGASMLRGLYKDMPEVQKVMDPVIDPVLNGVQALGDKAKNLAAMTYQDVVNALPKNASGELTDQSRVVLNLVNERLQQQHHPEVSTLGHER
ncbi:hypothetical protein [Methylotenera sp. G11]|uniref:hypothetical protein n=1 Tax=Methylotenera sp. G11 TaxID=1506585 RepID=UPI0006461D7D|nr:hypothetical protein [Methylotenera sp. G11]